MTSADLAAFITQANATRVAVFGQAVRIASASKTACFTAPRLDISIEDSTLQERRYRSTLRILKSEVTSITTPQAWQGVLIELPEGSGWREYRAIPDMITDVILASEWKLEIESQ
jgi:hypothetical protein